MNESDIRKWAETKDAEWKTLLLGNGASRALSDTFRYETLYNFAREKNLLNTTVPIFKKLGDNFELVLLACWHAELVNCALGNYSPRIATAYNEVRDALLESIQKVHPPHAEISDKLRHAGCFASRFETVVTLNYDVTLYWAMMLFNNPNGRWFKDAFMHGGAFECNFDYLRKPKDKASGVTLVFYAHGNVVLARDESGEEIKIARDDGSETPDLLTSIAKVFREKKLHPLFVSEGTSEKKLDAIRRSRYLTCVHQAVLPEAGCGNIVIYGFSFSENDTHILEALKRKQCPPNLAVSVNTHHPVADQQAYCHRVEAVVKKHLPGSNVTFFDAHSPGCWSSP